MTKLGIQYDNATLREHSVIMIAAAYQRESKELIGTYTVPGMIRAGKGELQLDLSPIKTAEADYYKVFLMNNLEKLIPQKRVDVLNVIRSVTAEE